MIYLHDSFAAIRKSLGAIDAKNMFDPIEARMPARTRASAWPPALERHRRPGQPRESARAPRQLLRLRGVFFICT